MLYKILLMFSFKNHKLLVIAPHPDDEVLGCGGIIRRIKNEGGRVYVLFLTVGDSFDFSKKGLSTITQRQKEIETVAKFLKFDDYHIAFPGNDYHLKLDMLGQKELMETIERRDSISIEKVKPTIIAFPYPFSYNQDHRIAGSSTHAALRPAPSRFKHFVPIVLSYEYSADHWSLLNHFQPNFFIPLAKKDLEVKLSALKLYKSQLRFHPNPRSMGSLKALAYLRGSQSSAAASEAFVGHRISI